MTTPMMTTEELRAKGFEALVAALGPVDAVRFLRQFDFGHGDYTQERQKYLKGKSAREIFEGLRKETSGTG